MTSNTFDLSTSSLFNDQMTVGLLNVLRNTAGVRNLTVEPRWPCDSAKISQWEQRNACLLPDDVKAFYASCDGFKLTWSYKIEGAVYKTTTADSTPTSLPIGNITVNSLSDLTRLYDISSDSVNTDVIRDLQMLDGLSDSDTPKFMENPNVFELDSIADVGHVCLVYLDDQATATVDRSDFHLHEEPSGASIWLLDTSYCWHFLAPNFSNYFRKSLVHLGLLHWQLRFTDMGLTSIAEILRETVLICLNPMMAFGKGVRNQTFAAIIATFGAMTMGTILGWMLSVNVLLIEKGSLDITAEEIKTYCSLFGMGAIIGALPAGKVASAIGNRHSMILFEAFVVLGWTLLTVLYATWMLILGTILQGFGTGALCAIIPTYIGEISQDHVRGRLGSIFQLFLVFGFLYSYILSMVCSYTMLNAFCVVVPVIHIVGTFFIPESPYFLLSMNKIDEAEMSLMKLRGDDNVLQELAVLKDHIFEQEIQQNTLKKVFTNSVNHKSLMFGIGCMFFQQMCGIVIMYYLRNLFLHFNSRPNQDHTTLIIIGIVQIVVSFVPMVFIDKIGRRLLLITSAIMMSFCLIGLACYCSSHIELDSKVDWIILVLIAIYISSFTLGLGPVPLVIIGEIFSTKVKPYGTSIATAVNWSLFFLVTYFPKEMINFMSYFGIFLMYYIFCICCAGFVFFVMPETKDKSLIGIQLMLATDGDLPLSTPSRSDVDSY